MESIRELLQSLDEELNKSGSSKSPLSHVLSYWLGILEHLEDRKRQTLLSNSNPFWLQEIVSLQNVINDKSNQFILLPITFFQKVTWKALLHTLILKSKYFFINIQPLRPIMQQYASNSRVSEFKNLHSRKGVAARLLSVHQNCSGILHLVKHSC